MKEYLLWTYENRWEYAESAYMPHVDSPVIAWMIAYQKQVFQTFCLFNFSNKTSKIQTKQEVGFVTSSAEESHRFE